ncbi:ABC transporter substrate-binding protein [Actinophytocola xanthii]|uniref:Sugar ABC transporter substrate-binding protein n=1 Tax=Actinophytocola xanthii TaxID=1912961 RepID=A0A1Q8CC62_9PSEU|nr:extracellular solute-binding protein [Actinophytocola xanthii]OLF11938.1 sugar ABC transporter substrate-binding protein [Actinophytocola xanthii]
MSTQIQRSSLALVLAVGLAVTGTACGSDEEGDGGSGGKVAITVNGQPAKTQPFERKMFDQDVADFERAHPDIDIQPREGFMDPKTFAAKLAGGQLEDVFYVYLTDPANLIARRQAADITDYVKDVPHYEEIQPELREIFTDDNDRVYGLPTANYSMGLLYNRALFTRAGLDPDDPPATWTEVREAARKITALGDGTQGLAELSRNNQGGWHFTTWMYSVGGQIAKKDGDRWVADFNNDKGREVAETLHAMRWEDNTLGERQLLVFEDAQRMFGAGKLGMFVGAPDNIPPLVNQFKGDYADFGLAPLPGGEGTLIGGEGYMLNPKASPEKIRAGLTWVQWKYLNPDRMEQTLKTYSEQDQPIGLPTAPPNAAADVWVGDLREKQQQLREKYATVPVENYQSFVDGLSELEKNIEPPNAQQVYAALDNVMQGVLTNRNADIDALLADAETKVNTALAQVR